MRSPALTRLVCLLAALGWCALADARPAWAGMTRLRETAASAQGLMPPSREGLSVNDWASGAADDETRMEERAGGDSAPEIPGCPAGRVSSTNFVRRAPVGADTGAARSGPSRPTVDQVPLLDAGLVNDAGMQVTRLYRRESVPRPSAPGFGLFRPPRGAPGKAFSRPASKGPAVPT